jgi:hypothetical protein
MTLCSSKSARVALVLSWVLAIACTSDEHARSDTQSDAPTEVLRDALIFHTSFDQGTDADLAGGDPQIYTVPPETGRDRAQPGIGNPDVELLAEQGRFGGALRFNERNTHSIFYRAQGNVGFSESDWSGTVSFWLSLSPNEDLYPGYCDPIQITDVSYDDAAIWVDFTRDEPRQFRLGVFGDLDSWNPEHLSSDDYPFFFERLVVVDSPPFRRGEWTHVVVTYQGLNSSSGGTAQLFLNGRLQGTTSDIPEALMWDLANAEIRVGVNYTGLYDELAFFNRPLTQDEVTALYQLEGGVTSLRR